MKRALLIGINYRNTSSELKGCISDVDSIHRCLLDHGYKPENITIMTDDTDIKPTRRNIMLALLSLCISHDEHLFFHYSGHGSSVKDYNGDEEDGRDESIVPLDYVREGVILDDELRGIISCTSRRSSLVCILDCCHSGSGLDLTYSTYKKNGRYTLVRGRGDDTNGNVAMLSGCADAETSADAYIEGRFQGALTYAFKKSFAAGVTWEQLLERVRLRLAHGKYTQMPNLSFGRRVDLKGKIVL